MAKDRKIKIGEIRFSDAQKQIIAEGVESEFFQLLSRVYRPKRQTRIAVTALNAAMVENDLWWFKGMSHELDTLCRTMQEVADEWNKTPDKGDNI